MTPSSAPAGQPVVVSGAGDCANVQDGSQSIAIEWVGSKGEARVTGPDFSQPVTVPADLATGPHELLSRCALHGDLLARANFTVSADGAPAAPKLSLAPSVVRAGGRLHLRARRFPARPCAAGRAIEFFLDETRLDAVDDATDPASVSATATVPRDAVAGRHRVTGRCGRIYAERDVEVRAAAGRRATGSGPRRRGGPPRGDVSPQDVGHDPVAAAPGHPHAVLVSQAVPTLSGLPIGGPALAAAAALAALIVLLVAFPAELFNKTYEENETEIHGMFERVGLGHRHFPPVIGFVIFVVLGAGLMAWLALDEGSKGNPLAVAVGVLVALPVVTFAFRWPSEAYSRARSRIPGTLHVLPSALAVAVVCAVLSRLLKLEPPYLYGLVAAFAAVRVGSMTEEHEGRAVLVGVATLAAIALVAWIGWGALDGEARGADRGWAVIVIATALFWIFVLAAEGLVFALVPLRFLDGSRLRKWRTSAWLVPQLAAALFFVYVLWLHGHTEKIDSLGELVRPLLFFLGFGLFSFAFWGYFRWDKRPSRGLTPGGPAEPAKTGMI